MYTTDQKVSEATVVIQIRPTGEYGQRRRVTITVPADFDINDRTSTQVYYQSWNLRHNLPESNPFFAAIEAVQDKEKANLRLRELILTSRRGKSYVSVIGETHDNTSRIMRKMSSIFGEDVDFDTDTISP